MFGGWTNTAVSGYPTTAGSIATVFGGGLADGVFFRRFPSRQLSSILLLRFTSVLPAGGAPAGGTTVIIGGTGFTGATSLTFGANCRNELYCKFGYTDNGDIAGRTRLE